MTDKMESIRVNSGKAGHKTQKSVDPRVADHRPCATSPKQNDDLPGTFLRETADFPNSGCLIG
jgi:hypothetical protein